jgi:hypothetical protein
VIGFWLSAIGYQLSACAFCAFVDVFTNKSDSILFVKTPTNAKKINNENL